MEEHEKIELRSDDVQEILGTPPSWIVKWGTTIIFFSVAMLFLVSYIVKYPDIIHAPVMITTEMPPVPVVARTTGYLAKLAVKENDTVRTGDLLVVLQSSANYEDVLKLEEDLKMLENIDPSVMTAFEPDMTLNLGELQIGYSAFVQILKELKFKRTENYSSQNVAQIQLQIKNTERMIKTEQDKEINARKNAELANKRFEDKRRLYMEKVVSLNELEDAKKDALRYEQDIKNVHSQLEVLQGQKLQLEQSIMSVKQQSKETDVSKYVGIVEAFNQLRASIIKWKQTYLLSAPIDGRVSFYNEYWAQNQNVRDGAEVMAIVPPMGAGIIGLCNLPMSGSGKVKEGQKVVIKFDSYPYQQYGVVEGKVMSKALLPKDNQSISVRVQLTKGLMTSYDKNLKFEQQMQGNAEIITEERRFIERMFDKVISAFKN